MKIKVLLFAALKDQFASSQIELDVPASATVADLRRSLVTEQPALEDLLSRSGFGLGDEFVEDDFALSEGMELACIPPVSGG